MGSQKREKRAWVLFVWLLLLLLVSGVILLIVAHYGTTKPLIHDVLRDLGMAFLISALVAGAYEIYARTRFDLAKIESLLDTVYGSGVPVRVWESVKETLLQRELMRCNAVLHIRVLRDPAVSKQHVVLDVDLAYDLANLLSKAKEYIIIHGLDEHIVAADLPRFTEVSIGNRCETIEGDTWASPDQAIVVKGGRLYLKVSLPARSENAFPTPIRVRRQEVRECPGSYYMIATEVTDSLRVYLDECAEDVGVTLGVRPSERVVDLSAAHVQIINEPFLPGYSLEFKLTPRTDVPMHPLTD